MIKMVYLAVYFQKCTVEMVWNLHTWWVAQEAPEVISGVWVLWAPLQSSTHLAHGRYLGVFL